MDWQTVCEVDYFVPQALTGHGCFSKYLFQRMRTESESCNYCQQVDDAAHTPFKCPRWNDTRIYFLRETGTEFTETRMMRCLTMSEGSWKHTYKVFRDTITTKETDDNNKSKEVTTDNLQAEEMQKQSLEERGGVENASYTQINGVYLLSCNRFFHDIKKDRQINIRSLLIQ